jgi:hypothetical protein
MNRKVTRMMVVAAVIAAGFYPSLVTKGQEESLESQLAAKYKLVKLGTDSTGLAVVEAGTVLVIKKGGILSVPSGNAVLVPSTVKDGQIKTPNNTAMQGMGKLLKWKGVSDPTGSASADTKFLTVGEKAYVWKMDVNKKDSKVALSIIECDTCNGVQDPSNRKALVVFQFPKDYLNGADAGQVSDVINQILEIQPEDSGQQQQQRQDQGGQQQAQAAAPEQPAAPPQPPPTIQLGQTPDEVTA